MVVEVRKLRSTSRRIGCGTGKVVPTQDDARDAKTKVPQDRLGKQQSLESHNEGFNFKVNCNDRTEIKAVVAEDQTNLPSRAVVGGRRSVQSRMAVGGVKH